MNRIGLLLVLFAGLNIGTVGWAIDTFDIPAWWFEILGFVMLIVPTALIKLRAVRPRPLP